MSEFDIDAADLWDEVESVFGDPAILRGAAMEPINLVVVVDSDYRQVELRAGETVVSITLDTRGLEQMPLPGDQVEIVEGRHKGQYEYYQTINHDGYSLEIEARRI